MISEQMRDALRAFLNGETPQLNTDELLEVANLASQIRPKLRTAAQRKNKQLRELQAHRERIKQRYLLRLQEIDCEIDKLNNADLVDLVVNQL